MLAIALSAAAVVAMVVLIVAGGGDRGPDEPVVDDFPLETPRLGPGLLEVSTPQPLAESIPWEMDEFDRTRLVGLGTTHDGPVAAVNIGIGMSGLLFPQDTGSWQLAAAEPDRIDAVIDEGEELLLIGRDEEGAGIWVANAGFPIHVVRSDQLGFDYEGPYPGYITRLSAAGIDDLSAATVAMEDGSRRVIIGDDRAGGAAAWIQTDGGPWLRRSVLGLSEADIDAVYGYDGMFLAAGSTCKGETCRPSVWHSADGFNWFEPVRGFEGQVGRVTGLTRAPTGLYAVGTLDPGLGSIWRSTDRGLTWQEEPAVGLNERIDISVESIDADTFVRSARLTIAGAGYDVIEGDTLATSLGNVSVPAIGDMAVFVIGDEARALSAGETWSLCGDVRIEAVGAGADRYMVVGTRTLPGGSPEPTVWTRLEQQEAWERSVLPGSAVPTEVVLSGGRVAVLGKQDTATVVWTGSWDLTDENAAALASTRSLLDAFATGDPLLAWEMLDTARSQNTELLLPGMGGLGFDVWDADGLVDRGTLEGAVTYFSALDGNVSLRECGTAALFGEDGRIRVACGYEATSHVLAAMGIERSSGQLIAITRMGRVSSMSVFATAREERAWRSLEGFVSAFHQEMAAVGDSGDIDWLGLTKATAALAASHAEAAAKVDSFAFSPGEARTVSSPLGTLEFSWIEAPFGDDAMEITALSRVGDRFVAAVIHELDEQERLTMWESVDGTHWTQMSVPPGDPIIQGIAPLGDRLIAWGWLGEGSGVFVSADEGWREVPLPIPDGVGDWWIRNLVTGDGTAFVIVSARDPAMSVGTYLGFVVGEDRTVRALDLPFEQEPWEVMPSGDGEAFALAVWTADEFQLWRSVDDETWVPVAAGPRMTQGWPIGWTARRGAYLVFTEGDLEACSSLGEECYPPTGIWVSTDFVSWERVPAPSGMTFVGEVVAGDLGLATTSDFGDATKVLWLSPDGTSWAAPDRIVLDPGLDGFSWWSPRLAVGDAGLVIGITAADGGGNTSSTSVVVARLAEP